MEKLKPCPFCGAEAEIKRIGNNHTKRRKVELYCKKCVLTMVVGAIRNSIEWCEETVIAQWNRRHEPNVVHQFEGDNDEIISFIKRSLSAGKKYKVIIQEL